MTQLVFHHDPQKLPAAGEHLLPVQLYGITGKSRGDISTIGNPIIDRVQRLGIELSSQVMDFLTISLAVTAADTFVRRAQAEDGWTRQFTLELPLYDPATWEPLKKDLESALHFLSGDIWKFHFQPEGFPPPLPYQKRNRFNLVDLRGIDAVCLFSGGLDSGIGAIDLLHQGRSPLLVSHAYKGDKTHQDRIAKELQGHFSRFEVNADPHLYTGETDITMRTRSLNFLAFAAVGAFAVKEVNQLNIVDLFVPENGFISLNAPLTPRRIGSLSTRTTHPNFIERIQRIFNAAEIPCRIINPYQFMTKGQMALECQDRELLTRIVDSTVSCSHWKRSNQQCGICVPCIIRRAALESGNIRESTTYTFDRVSDVLLETDRRDDLQAMRIAINKKATRQLGLWIADSGPIPVSDFQNYRKVFIDGLNEVEHFLQAARVL